MLPYRDMTTMAVDLGCETQRKVKEVHMARVLGESFEPVTWPDSMRGIPNILLRTGLFGVSRRIEGQLSEVRAVPCQRDTHIVFDGARQDQADLDVLVNIYHLSRGTRFDEPIYFSEKGLLRLAGRGGEAGKNLGGNDIAWLRGALNRLSGCAVDIRTKMYEFKGPWLERYCRDTGGNSHVLLPKGSRLLFGHGRWTMLDWRVRSALRGFPLSMWLHGFYASHADPFDLRVATLHKLCGSSAGSQISSTLPGQKNKALLDWQSKSLLPALVRLSKVSNGHGNDFTFNLTPCGLVQVKQTRSPSQERHVIRKLSTATR